MFSILLFACVFLSCMGCCTNIIPFLFQVISAPKKSFATAVTVSLRLTSSCGVDKKQPATSMFKSERLTSYADLLKV